jgi:hypothetical protein
VSPALVSFIAACDEPALMDAIIGLDRAAILNRDARGFLAALEWIAGQDRSLDEKLGAVAKLIVLPKAHVLIPSAKAFFGW